MSTGITIKWIEEWSQFFQSCNWYTFDLFMAEIDNDIPLGTIEGTFILLGLGIHISWTYKVTKLMQRIERDAKDFIRRQENETNS